MNIENLKEIKLDNLTDEDKWILTKYNEIVNSYTVIFTVRNYHKIDEFMRVLWKGKLYRILSIENSREKQSLTINAELING